MMNRLLRGIAPEPTNAPEIDVAGTVEAQTTGAAQIVDVREPEEWADGYIPGAIHIPLGEVANRTEELDPNHPVIAVCRSGQRSLTAADILIKAGFVNVKSMAGGMLAWADEGEPMMRG